MFNPSDFFSFFSFIENRTGQVGIPTQSIVEGVIAVFRQLEKDLNNRPCIPWHHGSRRPYKTVASFPDSPTPERKYAGRAWYLLSRENDVIRKGQNFRTER